MDNLLARINFVIEIIWLTGLAPWVFEFHFPGSLLSTVLVMPPYAINMDRRELRVVAVQRARDSRRGHPLHRHCPPRTRSHLVSRSNQIS